MFASQIVREITAPPAERLFLEGLGSPSDPKLQNWARNYYFFSVHQARHLALMIGALPPTERLSLAEVAKALFEEYGSGRAEQVHSGLFERFALAAGVAPAALSAARTSIAPAALAYVDAIAAAYTSGDLATALGAYAYLERSAVLSYPLMLERFEQLGFSGDALAFFHTHVLQEKAHDAAASEMVDRLLTAADQGRFDARIRHMDALWSAFWESFA